MAPKIFITGATGYVGGDVLYALNEAHPDWEYTALVRNFEKGVPVAASYPKVRLVHGSLDDSTLLEEEAAKANVVIHTANSADHAGSAQAIAKGIAAGHSKEHPGYWLHTSGTGILTWHDLNAQSYGEGPSQEPYDDLEGVARLTSLPDQAVHRDVEKIVLDAGVSKAEVIKTAIVCPPTIYGQGRGTDNGRSMQVYNLAKAALERGKVPQLGKGLTEWDNVHIHDLSNLFVLLAEAAVAKDPKLAPHLWGKEGYFLAENGHHVWGQVSKQVGEAAVKGGYIESAEVEVIGIDVARKSGGFTWGLNSKGFAKRARKYLGWKPTGESLVESIPGIVAGEAKLLGLSPGK